jgi:hypothetical protein
MAGTRVNHEETRSCPTSRSLETAHQQGAREFNRIAIYCWHPSPIRAATGPATRSWAATPQHQPTLPPPPNYIIHLPPLPNHNIPLPNYHIPYHQPPSPPHNQYIPPPLQFNTTDPKSPLANHLQLAPWPPYYRASPTQISWKCQPSQISYVLRSYCSYIRRRRNHPHQILNHFLGGRCRKLVFQDPARMHLFLAAVERKVLAQFPRFSSGAQLGRRFSIMHLGRKRNTPQFLPEVLTNESTRPGDIRRSSHHTSYQSLACGTAAHPSSQRAVQNSAGAL